MQEDEEKEWRRRDQDADERNDRQRVKSKDIKIEDTKGMREKKDAVVIKKKSRRKRKTSSTSFWSKSEEERERERKRDKHKVWVEKTFLSKHTENSNYREELVPFFIPCCDEARKTMRNDWVTEISKNQESRCFFGCLSPCLQFDSFKETFNVCLENVSEERERRRWSDSRTGREWLQNKSQVKSKVFSIESKELEERREEERREEKPSQG